MERRTGLFCEKGTASDNECSPLLNEMPRRLKLSIRIAYGMGHIMNDICAAVWFSYTMLFLQVVLGMAPLLAGSMLLIGKHLIQLLLYKKKKKKKKKKKYQKLFFIILDSLFITISI